MSDSPKKVLVVEDDARQRGVIVEFLESRGYRVRPAPDAETALDLLEKERSDLVLMDVRMPGMGGIEGLARMRERDPTLAIILLTAYAEVQDAVEAMRQGAIDYLEKPIDLDELVVVIAESIGEPTETRSLKLPPLPKGFVALSDAMRRVVSEASLVASTEATVLVTGESGTGKELIAEFLHNHSQRREGPFVRVNCAAMPQALVESELFGHVKGAFTGAETDREGRFEAAAGGTILLDEVGELSMKTQPKLLRILENATLERVGESCTRKADVRVIASTNRDLQRQVATNEFREDLFWRLNVFRIHLPPLRERSEEIIPLGRTFLEGAGKARVRLSPAAQKILEAYRWPGNVRELRNVVLRAGILATGDVILPEHLPDTVRGKLCAPGDKGDSGELSGEIRNGESPRVLTVEEAERRAIREALASTEGNRTRAAKLLGISRRTLVYKLKQYSGEP